MPTAVILAEGSNVWLHMNSDNEYGRGNMTTAFESHQSRPWDGHSSLGPGYDLWRESIGLLLRALMHTAAGDGPENKKINGNGWGQRLWSGGVRGSKFISILLSVRERRHEEVERAGGYRDDVFCTYIGRGRHVLRFYPRGCMCTTGYLFAFAVDLVNKWMPHTLMNSEDTVAAYI